MFGLRTSGVSLDELHNGSMVQELRDEGLLEVREDKVFLTST